MIRQTILVVDDEKNVLSSVARMLSLEGYDVLKAASGQEALGLAAAHAVDLVLLDVMMPGKNGWEVARELRSSKDLDGVGIVMLTAIGEKVNEMTSPLYGADDFVDKPFDFTELENKLAKVIENRRKQQQGQG